MKMVYYKLVNVTINAPGLVEVIFNMIIWYHGLSNSIVTDKGLFFILKFWLLLYYFFGIKQKFSTTFYS